MVVASVGERQLKVTVRLYAADGSVIKTLVSPDIPSNTGSKVGENGWLIATYNNVIVDITPHVDGKGAVVITFNGEKYLVPVANGVGKMELPDGQTLEVDIAVD